MPPPCRQALEFFYREEKWRRLSLTLGDSLRTVPQVRVGGSVKVMARAGSLRQAGPQSVGERDRRQEQRPLPTMGAYLALGSRSPR